MAERIPPVAFPLYPALLKQSSLDHTIHPGSAGSQELLSDS